MATLKLNDLLVGLTEVKTEVRGLREDVRDLKADIRGQITDHEARIRTLEKVRWQIAGGASVGGAVVTLVLQTLLKHI